MEQILIFILFLVSGYLLARTGLARSSDYRPIANFVFYVALPASILASFWGAQITPEVYTLIAVLLASFAASVIFSVVLSRLLRLEKNVFYSLLICGFFGNIVYFGFPFTQMILGEGSLPLSGICASVYNVAVFAVLLPAVSIKLGAKADANSITKAFLNPVVAFTFAGIAVLAFGIDMTVAMPYLTAFSSLTTPLSLLAMGIFLSDKFSIAFDKNLISIIAAKCLFLPIITFLLLLLTDTLAQGKEVLLLSLMPIAISNFVIVESLGLNTDKLVMDAIVTTSILSVIVLGFAELYGVF